MITDEKVTKVKHFYEVLEKTQSASGKNIGLIVIKDENLGDLTALTKNSNDTSIIQIDKNIDVLDFIKDLTNNLTDKKMVFIRLHKYLDPKIYNQFYLLTNNARMEYFDQDKDIVVNIPCESQIIIVMTDEELEELNYKDILNTFSPVLRLE